LDFKKIKPANPKGKPEYSLQGLIKGKIIQAYLGDVVGFIPDHCI